MPVWNICVFSLTHSIFTMCAQGRSIQGSFLLRWKIKTQKRQNTQTAELCSHRLERMEFGVSLIRSFYWIFLSYWKCLKVGELHLCPKDSIDRTVQACAPSYSKAWGKRIMGSRWTWATRDLVSREGRVARFGWESVVEPKPNMHKTLGSNPDVWKEKRGKGALTWCRLQQLHWL